MFMGIALYISLNMSILLYFIEVDSEDQIFMFLAPR